MTASHKIHGNALPPHVRAAIEDFEDDANLVEVAASAWSAEFQSLAARAAVELGKRFERLFGREFSALSPEWFDRQNPRECAGGTHDGLVFAWRGPSASQLSVVVQCAHKDCPQEVFGPVNGIVELGKVLSLIEDEKVDGEWKCGNHRSKKAAQGAA